MSKSQPRAAGFIHLVPTGSHYIPGVPAVEMDVTAERAAELLAYRPAAFTSDTEPAAPATDETAVEPEE